MAFAASATGPAGAFDAMTFQTICTEADSIQGAENIVPKKGKRHGPALAKLSTLASQKRSAFGKKYPPARIMSGPLRAWPA